MDKQKAQKSLDKLSADSRTKTKGTTAKSVDKTRYPSSERGAIQRTARLSMGFIAKGK